MMRPPFVEELACLMGCELSALIEF